MYVLLAALGVAAQPPRPLLPLENADRDDVITALAPLLDEADGGARSIV